MQFKLITNTNNKERERENITCQFEFVDRVNTSLNFKQLFNETNLNIFLFLSFPSASRMPEKKTSGEECSFHRHSPRYLRQASAGAWTEWRVTEQDPVCS